MPVHFHRRKFSWPFSMAACSLISRYQTQPHLDHLSYETRKSGTAAWLVYVWRGGGGVGRWKGLPVIGTVPASGPLFVKSDLCQHNLLNNRVPEQYWPRPLLIIATGQLAGRWVGEGYMWSHHRITVWCMHCLYILIIIRLHVQVIHYRKRCIVTQKLLTNNSNYIS